MKFLLRAITGFCLFTITIGLVGLGIWRVMDAFEQSGNSKNQAGKERSFIVQVGTLAPSTIQPRITAFGSIRAWRTLDIRSPVQEPIVELSKNFRDGAFVQQGELLFRVDDSDAKRSVADAHLALQQADVDYTEAVESIGLVESEVGTALRQLELRKSDLERKKKLIKQGYASENLGDDAAYAVAAAEQVLSSKQKAVVAAKKTVEMTRQAVERTKIKLREAEKELKDTRYYSPFSGQLTSVVATLGRRVTTSEILAKLIDPAGLEVSFRVLDDEYGRLLSDKGDGSLRPRPVKITLELGSRKVVANGVVDRSAAETSLAQGGQIIFARLTGKDRYTFKPGDFVTVEVEEEALQNVAILPASAVSSDGRIFIVNKDERLKEVQGELVRRQGQNWIMSGLPFGESYVRARLPYLSDNIKVKTRREGQSPKPMEMTNLSEERRSKLIAFVKTNKRMPDAVKSRLVKRLSQAEVPKSLVERFEKRLARKSNSRQFASRNLPRQSRPVEGNIEAVADTQLVSLSAEDRRRLKAFIESRQRMPAQEKRRILSKLDAPKVPKEMVDRIEARIKGQSQ